MNNNESFVIIFYVILAAKQQFINMWIERFNESVEKEYIKVF